MDSDDLFKELCDQLAGTVIRAAYERRDEDDAATALLFFLTRVANTWRSINVLRDSTRNDPHQDADKTFLLDAAALIRAMIDAYIQAAYIYYQGSSRQTELASLYLEFQHVEKYRCSKKALAHDTGLSSQLKQSPKRPDGEKRLEEEYDRVKHLFTPEGRNQPRKTWYEGSLRDLAEEVTQKCAYPVLAEYDFFVSQYNGAVHSSAFAVEKGPMFSASSALTLASMVLGRVVELNVNYHGLELEQALQATMEGLCHSLLG